MNITVVLSTGRSGTKWLRETLSKANSGTVVHEPDGGLHDLTRKSAFDENFRREKAEEIKKKMKDRAELSKSEHYIRVDSFLRNLAEPFVWDKEINVIHLIRDFKLVVRSHLGRHSVVENDEWQELTPKNGKHAKNWDNYNNFQKACWYVYRPNRYMDTWIDNQYRLEDLTNDFQSIKNIAEECGINNFPKDKWESMKDSKTNKTEGSFKIPHPDDWSKGMQDEFHNIFNGLYEKHYE